MQGTQELGVLSTPKNRLHDDLQNIIFLLTQLKKLFVIALPNIFVFHFFCHPLLDVWAVYVRERGVEQEWERKKLLYEAFFVYIIYKVDISVIT